MSHEQPCKEAEFNEPLRPLFFSAGRMWDYSHE
jgi:hypothetical protein